MPLFATLRRLFEPRTPAPAAATAIPAPSLPAPPSPCATRETVRHSVMVCEPILGRDERIVGHRFALNHSLLTRARASGTASLAAYEDVLLRGLPSGELAALAQHQLVCIGLSRVSLTHPALADLPRHNVALLLTPTPGDTPADVAAQAASIAAQGFQAGLHAAGVNELLACGDPIAWFEVDTSQHNGMQLRHLAGELRAYRSLRRAPLRLLAQGLQNDDDFRFCRRAGFDGFSGRFTGQRDGWRAPESEVNRLRVIDVLNQLRGGADYDVIVTALKPDPVLTFKLLRHINSAGAGLQQAVDSVARGLVVLGRDRFYRWLSLLLFDFGQPGYRERMLTAQALTRARFLELLAGRGRIPPLPDALFMVGLFSLLDALLGRPLTELVQAVDLPPQVATALQGQPGALSDALALACASETDDPLRLDFCAALCRLDALTIASVRLSALNWCEQVNAGKGTGAPDAE